QTKKALEALQISEASLYTNGIALADRYRQAHDADRADELLDDCPDSLRDWEWRYLKRRHFEDVTVYPDHDGPVASVALSPDSRRLVAGHEDDTVRVWDIATGTLRTLSGHKKIVEDVAFSPDGRLLASASLDRTIRIWDGQTYELRATLSHERPVLGLAFHPQ